ncbi:MAG: hypothetical protein H0W78_05295 [Planctomycetes bacterium]|nr:hypothetical protein [Planctomycetota bacterium]
MSAQDLLIAHGEKALVLLVAAACGYGLYGTFTNPAIRPTDISMEKINDMVGTVERERGSQPPPVLKAPSNYLDDMLARWAVQLPSSKYYASLSAATDVGPPDIRSSQYYIYEIHPPKLAVIDNIGNLDLTITLPASQRTTDVRISDAPSKTWSLEGRADNKAQWLGLRIEFRVGAGMWQPFTGKEVKGGLLPLKEGATSVTVNMPTVEPWQRHYFRARLIAKATGLPLDQMKSNDQQQTILVSQGTYPNQDLDWAKLQHQIGDVVTGDKAVLGKFQSGSKEGAFVDQLKAGELLYTSNDSVDVNVLATDSIRFVFDKVNQDFQNPANSGATILLSKYLRDPRAQEKNAGKWMDPPHAFKLAPGEGLGGDVDIQDQFGDKKLKVRENLMTSYVLTEVKTGVKRVIYYELYPQSRPMGGRSKDLKLNTKEIDTEVAILTNTKTGKVLELPRCERLNKPNKPLSVFYPDFAGTLYNETDEFKKNPARFKQNDLQPKEPLAHEPGTGPLEDLRKRTNDPLKRTDTVYYELPDGRLVYWEDVNNRMVVIVREGSEAAADKEAADKEAADKAAAEAAAKAAEEAKAAADAPKETKPAPK